MTSYARAMAAASVLRVFATAIKTRPRVFGNRQRVVNARRDTTAPLVSRVRAACMGNVMTVCKDRVGVSARSGMRGLPATLGARVFTGSVLKTAMEPALATSQQALGFGLDLPAACVLRGTWGSCATFLVQEIMTRRLCAPIKECALAGCVCVSKIIVARRVSTR